MTFDEKFCRDMKIKPPERDCDQSGLVVAAREEAIEEQEYIEMLRSEGVPVLRMPAEVDADIGAVMPEFNVVPLVYFRQMSDHAAKWERKHSNAVGALWVSATLAVASMAALLLALNGD